MMAAGSNAPQVSSLLRAARGAAGVGWRRAPAARGGARRARVDARRSRRAGGGAGADKRDGGGAQGRDRRRRRPADGDGGRAEEGAEEGTGAGSARLTSASTRIVRWPGPTLALISPHLQEGSSGQASST